MGISTPEINIIIDKLIKDRGFDFSGYRTSLLERRILKRIQTLNLNSSYNYITYLENNSDELDNLIDVLTINVSSFFRNPFSFEYIEQKILPELIQNKIENSFNLRIWSAGCASGEEPYSVAIILNELLLKTKVPISVNLFATDIDVKTLNKAKAGVYQFHQIENIKHGIFTKYFTAKKDQFLLDSEIKELVNFSSYDLISAKSAAPPESIFGGFDMVLCRNVLIYYDLKNQEIIFNKLYKTLNVGGYLILGESEVIPQSLSCHFQRESNLMKIYRKLR